MSYLVDSDYVADYLRGRSPAVDVLAQLAPEGLAISLITYGEIYEGIYFGTNRERYERGFRLFLRGVDVLTLNRRVMQRFAQMRGELRQSGKLIGDMDLLIGATALHYNLTIVTHNVRHFQRIPSLLLYQSS